MAAIGTSGWRFAVLNTAAGAAPDLDTFLKFACATIVVFLATSVFLLITCFVRRPRTTLFAAAFGMCMLIGGYGMLALFSGKPMSSDEAGMVAFFLVVLGLLGSAMLLFALIVVALIVGLSRWQIDREHCSATPQA